jgi:hypothetical protein
LEASLRTTFLVTLVLWAVSAMDIEALHNNILLSLSLDPISANHMSNPNSPWL